jgi:hypothetical protein
LCRRRQNCNADPDGGQGGGWPAEPPGTPGTRFPRFGHRRIRIISSYDRPHGTMSFSVNAMT